MFLGPNFIFIENPKTGSTSMQNAMRKAGLGDTILNKHEHFNHAVEQKYNRRWRVCCVRNPWDRMVSGFHHSNRSHTLEPSKWPACFEEWLLGDKWELSPGYDFKRVPQHTWLWKANLIIRFEEMVEEFPRQMHKMGHQNVVLPHDNQAKVREDYRFYYNDRTREVVRDRFLPDITRFRYEF